MTFFLSKIIWYILNPFNLILLLFAIGIIFNLYKLKTISKVFFLFSLFLFLISTLLPTGYYLTYLLEKDFHNSTFIPDDIDGVLIFSGATNPYLTKEYGQVSLNDSAERLFEAKIVLEKKNNLKIIFSGGSGYINSQNNRDYTSAKKFFVNMGIDVSRIIFEKKSRNTFENIIYSKKIANPLDNEKWLVITSASHLKRVLNVSEKIKWNLIPYATDFNYKKNYQFELSINFFNNLFEFQKASHEWVGLIAYYFLDRTNRIY